MDKSDPKQVNRTLAELASSALDPKEYPALVCGSCYHRRDSVMFGQKRPICMALPPQVICIPQPQGAQIISTRPVIEKLAEETCTMWKPREEDQH